MSRKDNEYTVKTTSLFYNVRSTNGITVFARNAETQTLDGTVKLVIIRQTTNTIIRVCTHNTKCLINSLFPVSFNYSRGLNN